MVSFSPKGTKIPIIEIFGPTIQGEGAMIGEQTTFVRTGGCDFRCTYCDSMHAVDQVEIRKRSIIMFEAEIAAAVLDRMDSVRWVTLSGGNPALWDFYRFIAIMHEHIRLVAVETQGSKWQPWIQHCDQITISPKGPSMIKDLNWGEFAEFMDHIKAGPKVLLKIPCFSTQDLDFAEEVATRYPHFLMSLSVGNHNVDEHAAIGDLRDDLLEAYQNLISDVFRRPALSEATVLPQLHTLLWGNEVKR